MVEEEIEITVEVFDEMDIIKNKLQEAGLNFTKTFTLHDIYFKNKDTNRFFINDGHISDVLIIRRSDDGTKLIICKQRHYDDSGFEIGTTKTKISFDKFDEAKSFLNSLGFEEYLEMIDEHLKFENDNYRVFIQQVKELGVFLEVEATDLAGQTSVQDLITFVKNLGLKIGDNFNVRKADMLYAKKNYQKVQVKLKIPAQL